MSDLNQLHSGSLAPTLQRDRGHARGSAQRSPAWAPLGSSGLTPSPDLGLGARLTEAPIKWARKLIRCWLGLGQGSTSQSHTWCCITLWEATLCTVDAENHP